MSMCACGYINECGLWCGNGHISGLCPPNTKENIEAMQREIDRPRCDYCGEAAPYGDPRNIWVGMHEHRIGKLLRRIKSRVRGLK